MHFLFILSVFLSIFPLMEIPLIFGLCHYLWCPHGNNHSDVHFRLIGPVPLLSKDGKEAVREGGNGWRSVYFPPESASFPL